jgi:hypothetical protein
MPRIVGIRLWSGQLKRRIGPFIGYPHRNLARSHLDRRGLNHFPLIGLVHGRQNLVNPAASLVRGRPLVVVKLKLPQVGRMGGSPRRQIGRTAKEQAEITTQSRRGVGPLNK